MAKKILSFSKADVEAGNVVLADGVDAEEFSNRMVNLAGLITQQKRIEAEYNDVRSRLVTSALRVAHSVVLTEGTSSFKYRLADGRTYVEVVIAHIKKVAKDLSEATRELLAEAEEADKASPEYLAYKEAEARWLASPTHQEVVRILESEDSKESVRVSKGEVEAEE